MAVLPVVASIFTSLGFKTFLPNGISVGPGYPLITSLNSTHTGKLVSFSEKNKSTDDIKHPPSSDIKNVCASGSILVNCVDEFVTDCVCETVS